MFLCVASLGGGQPTAQSEGQLRARALTLLGRAATWPERPGLDPQRPFLIGVLGISDFQEELEEEVKKLVIRNRRVVLRSMRRLDPSQLTACDVLYVCESEEERLSVILKMVKGTPVLVVGGTAGFAHRGVMLNLPARDGRLAMEVNLKALKEAGLEIPGAFFTVAGGAKKVE